MKMRTIKLLQNYVLKVFDYNSFECNVCGNANFVKLSELDRELQSYKLCLSTVRLRTIVKALQDDVLKFKNPISELPINKNIKGFGLSNDLSYSTVFG